MHSQRRLIFPCLHNKASILIFTLWALFLLSIFGVYLGRGVRQKLALVKKLTFRSNLRYIAEAGVRRAVFEVVKDTTAMDALNEEWSNNPAVFDDIGVGMGAVTVSYDFLTPGGTVQTQFGVIDEERKININVVERHTIQNLIEVVMGMDEEEAQEIAASIIDWRDKDSFLSIPIGSAEDSYYDNRDEPYACKDSEFQVLEELLLVKGVSPQVYSKIKGFITIYGNGIVNINTVSSQVLLALEIDQLLIDKIISFREGEDEAAGTGDDNIFDVPSSIVPSLSQAYSLSPDEVASLSNLVSAGTVGTSSYNFMIRSQASIGPLGKEIVCVVNKEGKVLAWRE